MKKPVTQQEIARQLKLHGSTVSLALRNDPRLPESTRVAVQVAAKKLGYTPNVNARALAVHKRLLRPESEHGTLAFLVPSICQNIYLHGAQKRARELGYQLEMIPYRDPILSEARLTKILRSRGITGLLVLAPFVGSKLLKRLRLDWDSFSAVTFSHTLLWPPIHRVSSNQFRNMKQLIRRLAARGYRRIGFYANELRYHSATDGGWRGGYLVEMERWGKVPEPLYRTGKIYDPVALRKWIHTQRLDAVITDYDYAANQVIAEAGRAVPEELGVASVACDSGTISGINPQFSEIGGVAVNFLVHLMHSHQRGIPEFAQRLLLEGIWSPGTTVRSLRKYPTTTE